MAYDRYRSKVISLLNFDGSNGSTAFADEAGKVWTANTGAVLTTSSPQFGTACGDFTGSSANISTPDSNDWYFSNGDFTLEMFVNVNAWPGFGGTSFLAGQRASGSSSNSWALALAQYSAGEYLFRFSQGSTGAETAYSREITSIVSLGAWHHFACSRNGNLIRLFVDGGQLGDPFDVGTLTLLNSTAIVRIGAINSSATGFVNAKIDSWRATKGVGRYTEDFATPTDAFSLRGSRVSGVVQKGSPAAPAQRKIFIVRTSDLSLVGTGLSDPDDGSYEVETDADVDEALLGMAYPDYGEPPIRSHVYALGDRTWYGAPAPLGHWYECEQAGTTGSTAPTWPTDGSTVTDGTVIWRDKGVMERPWAEGPYIAEAV